MDDNEIQLNIFVPPKETPQPKPEKAIKPPQGRTKKETPSKDVPDRKRKRNKVRIQNKTNQGYNGLT